MTTNCYQKHKGKLRILFEAFHCVFDNSCQKDIKIFLKKKKKKSVNIISRTKARES